MSQKWYYDACVLTTKETYDEIYNGNKRHGTKPIISNLAIGEACGNRYRKAGMEALNSFFILLARLDSLGVLEIVDHRGIDKILQEITNESELDITDAIHLATAIYNGCCNFRTIDRDLYGIPRDKVSKIAEKFSGIRNFVISKM